jgi:S-formylglutathione hydrolase FrmB
MKLLAVAGLMWTAAVVRGEAEPFMVWNNPPSKPIPHLQHHSYPSAAMGTEVGYNIYLPPGYATDTGRRYPVVYWCHGRGCTESNDQFPAGLIDDGIRRKFLPPMIVVYLSGGSRSFYSDSVDGRWLAETTIIRELIPHIDAKWRTIAARDGRAIQGMSMGGFGALKLALKYPDFFSSAVAFAGAFRQPEEMTEKSNAEIFARMFNDDADVFLANHPATIARTNRRKILDSELAVRLYVGTADGLLESSRAMHRVLTEIGLSADCIEFHNVRHDLPKLAELIKTDALEFAVTHFGISKAADCDGPWLNAPSEPVVGCQHHLFFSDAMQRPVGYNIYLPPAYVANPSQRFPVIYYLHGMTDSESTHLCIAEWLDQAIRVEQVPDLIFVAVYGGRSSWFTDYADGSVRSESVFVNEFIPHIDARWRTLADRGHRALQGFNMGGAGALRIACRHPDLFSSVVMFSGGFRTLDEMTSEHADQIIRIWGDGKRWEADSVWALVRERASILRSKVALRQVVGTSDFLLEANRRMHKFFEEMKIPVDYRELRGVAHDPRAIYSRCGVRCWQFHAAHFAD